MGQMGVPNRPLDKTFVSRIAYIQLDLGPSRLPGIWVGVFSNLFLLPEMSQPILGCGLVMVVVVLLLLVSEASSSSITISAPARWTALPGHIAFLYPTKHP
jgi:hypothetical protein